ncbi:MAG: glycosyltransferase family 2 protein [Candidatus Dormiibacterota bacterium]
MTVSPTSYTVVVLPAYQAERTLGATLADLPPGAADHVLLVDDASRDATVAVARSLGIDVRTRTENGGYGANQKTCYREALRLGATVVVLLHPDYQYDPKSVPALVAPILAGEADMTFGSRFANGADPRKGGMPGYRYYGNRLTTVVENRLLGTQFSEMHSGMRAYSRAVLERLPLDQYSDDFLFDTQLLVGAHQLGFRIREVPIPTRYTSDSSSIGIRRSLTYVVLSVREAWRASRAR